MAGRTEGPFDYTATGVLGDKRNTMLKNELHLRNKLGHPKVRGHNLPGTNLVFGSSSHERGFSAAHALRGWADVYPNKSSTVVSKPVSERDFLNLNKAALTDGLIRASENFDYRATHDIRRSPSKQQKSASKLPTRRLPPTMVFGVPTRPSTPIFDLLEHRFQERWFKDRQKQLEDRRSADAKRRVMSAPAHRGQRIIYETRSSLLRTYQTPVDPPPLWHMSRFSKSAKPHIQTFNTDASISGTFNNHGTDLVARRTDFRT